MVPLIIPQPTEVMQISVVLFPIGVEGPHSWGAQPREEIDADMEAYYYRNCSESAIREKLGRSLRKSDKEARNRVIRSVAYAIDKNFGD